MKSNIPHLIESVQPHYVFLFKELIMTSQDVVTGQVAIATLLCKQQAKTQWHLLPSLASSTAHSCLSTYALFSNCSSNTVFLFTLVLQTQNMLRKLLLFVAVASFPCYHKRRVFTRDERLFRFACLDFSWGSIDSLTSRS